MRSMRQTIFISELCKNTHRILIQSPIGDTDPGPCLRNTNKPFSCSADLLTGDSCGQVCLSLHFSEKVCVIGPRHLLSLDRAQPPLSIVLQGMNLQLLYLGGSSTSCFRSVVLSGFSLNICLISLKNRRNLSLNIKLIC